MTQQERSIITELAKTLGELVGRFDEQEKARDLSREQEKDWRIFQTSRLDALSHDVTTIKTSLSEVPQVVDEKLSRCRSAREVKTADAEGDAEKKRAWSAVLRDWRTWTVFAMGIAGLANALLK